VFGVAKVLVLIVGGKWDPNRERAMKGNKDRVRLALDFPNLRKMKEWIEEACRLGLVPEGTAMFRADGLDMMTTGVTTANTFVVRCECDRYEAAKV
jgi:hypothetical protein